MLFQVKSFTIVVEPETNLNVMLGLSIHDAVKFAFVHSCDGLAKAAKLFCSKESINLKISLNTIALNTIAFIV